MAEPARVSAADREPPGPEREPGPAERGWLDLQQAAVTAVRACVLAVQEMAGRPDSGAAVSMAELTRGCAEKLGDVACAGLEAERARVLAGAVREAELQRAYDEGYAACQAARCRLSAVPGT